MSCSITLQGLRRGWVTYEVPWVLLFKDKRTCACLQMGTSPICHNWAEMTERGPTITQVSSLSTASHWGPWTCECPLSWTVFSYNSIFQFQFEFQFKFPIISISANNYGSMSVIHNGGKAKLEKLLTSLEKRDFQLRQVKELSSKMYLMDTHHSAFSANWTKLCRGKALKIMPWSSQWV